MAIIIGRDTVSTQPLPTRRNKPAHVKSQDIFFPLAAIHAALFVPLSVLAMTVGAEWLPGLAGAGHAFEMFFGFALALLGGYLLGPTSKAGVTVLVVLWLGGRAAVLLSAGPRVIAVFTIAYTLVLAWKVVPRFRHAKKWRNRAITWILLAIFTMPLLWLAVEHGDVLNELGLVPVAPVLLFGLLMAFMGGRIIAPAAAGEIQRTGGVLEARVQPRIEGAIVILGGLSLASIPVLGMSVISAGLIAAIGVVTLLRLMRWRLWACRRRPDILAMGIGYAWLSAGFIATGLSVSGVGNFTGAVHLMTVGALGTLSTSVMLQQLYLRKVKRHPGALLVYGTITLLGVAAFTRWLTANGEITRTSGLWIAAGSWSVVYILVAFQLLRYRKAPNRLQPASIDRRNNPY